MLEPLISNEDETLSGGPSYPAVYDGRNFLDVIIPILMLSDRLERRSKCSQYDLSGLHYVCSSSCRRAGAAAQPVRHRLPPGGAGRAAQGNCRACARGRRAPAQAHPSRTTSFHIAHTYPL